MPLTLHLQHAVHTRARPTDRAMRIAAMFGLPLDAGHTHTILPPIELALAPGRVVFVTGVSGGGKSTLLRRIPQAIDAASSPSQPSKPAVVSAAGLPTLPEAALVDALSTPEAGGADRDAAAPPATLEDVCRWLSLAGLNDAAVMLRRPSELSEGQRHRLKLAQAIAVAERRSERWAVLLADEFGSTLDRTTAHALARSARKWVARSPVCLVAATAHDDLLEPLQPDTLVEVGPGGSCEVHTRSD